MAVAFVKNHPVASNKTAGTTLGITLSTDVPAGNVIVARILYDNASVASKPLMSSLGVAAGETNTWQGISANSTSTSAGSFASGIMTHIATTVTWPAGSYTLTLDTSVTQKAGFFQEFSGVLSSRGGNTPGSALSATTSPASASTTGTAPAIGDLALGFIFGPNVATSQAGDTDTTGGAWSAVAGFGTTGGNITTNNFGIGQYKIVTSTSQQTLNNSANLSAGNAAIVIILRQAPDPSITQAAYQWFDEGTESGAVALAAQDTAVIGNIANGDATGTLRVRLQSTTAVTVPATDDWQLQYEKNTSGTWVNITPSSLVVQTYDSPNLTGASASTNRLTGGTGGFTAGEVSEDGTANDKGWAGNGFTEFVYALKVIAADVVDEDVLRFRILRNGATATMTYAVTPTIDIEAPVALSASSSGTSTVTAALAADRPLVGAAAGLSTVTADLDVVAPGPFDPMTSIAWNTVFWASDPGETPPANGAAVASWRQPGSITINEWAGINSPTFVANWLNARPAIRFGPNARLWSAFAPSYVNQVTVVLVGQAGLGNVECDFFDDPGFDTAGGPRILLDRSSGEWRLYRGSLIATSTGAADDNPHLFIVRYNGNAGGDYLKVDGVTKIGPTSTGLQINKHIALGATVSNPDSHQEGWAAFCGVITGRDLTTQEQTDLFDWYTEYYLTLPPPGPVDLAGSSSGLSTTTSTLARAVPMVAAAGGLSTVTSALVAARSLAGASAGLSTVISATVVARALAASTVGISTVTSDMTVGLAPIDLVGQSNGVSTCGESGLAVSRVFVGASSGLSTTTGAQVVSRTLIAAATGTSTVTATTFNRAIAITTESGGLSSVTGALGLAKPMAAGVAGASSATGTLVVARSLTASTAGVSTVTAATVARAVPLAASVAGLTTVTGAMATADALVASTAGTATVTGALAVARSLAASAAGVASTSAIAVVSGAGGMTAFVIGTSTVTGALGVARSLVGGTGGTAVSTGDLAKIVQLTAASGGSSTTTAAMAAARRLIGSSAGATMVTADFVGTTALVGSSSGSSATSALLGKAIPVTAAAAGSSTAGGTRVANALAMVASTDGSSTVTGTTARIARALTAAAGGSTTATADVLAVVLDMMASSNGISATSGELGLVAPMFGVWNGQAFDAMMYGPYEVVDFLLIPPA